jgi:hypothetical protein
LILWSPGEGIDRFLLPDCFKIGPAARDEVVVSLACGAERRVTFSLDDPSQLLSEGPVLPDDFDVESVPLIVLALDQGGIGMSGMFFAIAEGAMVSPRSSPFFVSCNVVFSCCTAAPHSLLGVGCLVLVAYQ